MNKRNEILHRISLIRDSHKEMINIFTKGSCYNFYKILHSLYPNTIAYYNGDHVVSNIDGTLYDINGIVRDKKRYLPLSEKCLTSKLERSMKFKFTGLGDNPIVIEYEKGKGFSLHDPEKEKEETKNQLNKKDNGTELTKQQDKH